jgi:hypothetical protein
MLSLALVLSSGIKLVAQDAGGGNLDPAQIQQRIAQYQQWHAQMLQTDPAQLQQMASQFLPGIANMDPAQFQQLAQQWQQGIDQFQQRVAQANPAQIQPQRTVDLRELLQVTDDAEWSVVEALIQKVTAAQRVIQGDHVSGVMGQGSQIGRLQFGAAFATKTSPETDAVGKAIQSNASKQEIQAALTQLVEARKAHVAALEKAQAELRKVLTLRQEAIATLYDLL